MSGGPWEDYAAPARAPASGGEAPWLDYAPAVEKPVAAQPAQSGFRWPSLGSVINGMMGGASEDVGTVRNVLGNVTLSGLAKGAYDSAASAVTLPNDVYEGRVDPRSDEAIRRAVDFAGVASPVSAGSRAALAPAAAVAPKAATEASDLGIRLTAGQRTGDPALLSAENAMAGGASGAPAQRVAQEAIDRQRAEVTAARDVLGDVAGRGQADLQRSADAGAAAIEGVKGAAQQARTGYQERYADAFAQPGSLDPRVFQGFAEPGAQQLAVPGSVQSAFAGPISERIATNLAQRAEPVIIDPTLTPGAAKALRELDGISNLQLGLNGQPAATDAVVGVNLRGVDQARRRLAAYSNAAANNPSDARAIRSIIGEFDGQIQTAMENGLFSGSDDALMKLRDARAAFSSYQKTFRPQGAGDDVGNALRAITDRDATPEQVANYLYGSAKIGGSGLSVRLADRLKGILGEESADWAAIRQGAWQRVTGPADTGAKRASDRILDFVDGEGKSLSTRLFSEEERAQMRKFGNTLRALASKPGTTNPSNSGNRLAGLARQTFGVIGSMLGASTGGPVGAAAGYMVGRGAEAVGAARAAGQARQLFDGQAPLSLGQRVGQASGLIGAQATPRLALPVTQEVGPGLYRALQQD